MKKWLFIFVIITQLYSQPSYDSKASFLIPQIIKIDYLENRIVLGVLWAHLRISGIIRVEGWVPLIKWEVK